MNAAPNWRQPRVECDAYLVYVRCLPCCICKSRFKSDAHHRIGHGRLGGKTDDYEAMPLCQKHHAELHNNDEGGWESFEQRHEWSQLDAVRKTLLQALRDGVLNIDKKCARYIAG